MANWILIATGLSWIFLGTRGIIMHDRKFPSGSKLKADANGIIHHPTYGDYPQKVKYQEGMTLYPGQEAEFELRIEHPDSGHDR